VDEVRVSDVPLHHSRSARLGAEEWNTREIPWPWLLRAGLKIHCGRLRWKRGGELLFTLPVINQRMEAKEVRVTNGFPRETFTW